MSDSNTQQLHQQADLLLNSNQLLEAHAVYKQICSLDKNDAKAFMMRGALEGEMGKVDDALQSLYAAVRIDPGYADSYHTLAHLLQHTGKQIEARDALQKAVEIDPAFTEAWVMLSGLLGQLEDFAGSEAASRKVLELDPSNTDAQVNLANTLVEQSKDDEAVTVFQRVIKQQPTNAHILLKLGVILTRLERFDEAIPILEMALNLQPSDNNIQTALCFAYQGNKDFRKATELLQQMLVSTPNNEELWVKLVNIIDKTEKNDNWLDQVIFCEHLIERFPGNKQTILNLGYAFEKLEKLNDALEKYKQLALEFTDWGEGWNRLGLLHAKMEQNEQAVVCLRKAVESGVDSPLTFCMYGAALRVRGEYKAARHYCLLAVEKAPDLPPVYLHLGLLQTLMGELDLALETFHKGLALDPGNFVLITGISDILERQADYEKALEILEPCLDSDDVGIAHIVSMYAKVSNRLKRGELAIKHVEKALSRDDIMRGIRMDLHFRAADIYNSMQQFEMAIKHYHKANALNELKFDRVAHIEFIDDIIATFNKDTLAQLAFLGDLSARPIFIVGMPRSGTSLAEQILASHPDVYGAGELMDIAAIAQNLGFGSSNAGNYTTRLASLTGAETSQCADTYLQSIEELSSGERYVTDKLPYNYLYLGLIQILFPNARIIHTRRDPMDSCLSCYFLAFIGTHSYAYDLEDLGVYYREYERLMSHWRNVLSLPILDVQYEETVENIEATCRHMIDFCELDWDDRVLNFHQSKRIVKTASYDQVRRPVYTSSIGRWKPYEAWLDPLKKGLTNQ